MSLLLDKFTWHKPIPRFCERHGCKVCLSNSMKKAGKFSLPIFGLRKATEILKRCEVCPSWPTEKAQKYRVKDKSTEKPTFKDRADDQFPKNTE